MDTPDYRRLDQLMDARRLDLDMSWDDLALTAKISVATLRAIRRGDTDPRPITKRRIESALRWAPGSFDAIEAGGDPVPVEHDADESGEDVVDVLLDRIERDPKARARLRKLLGGGQATPPPNRDNSGELGQGGRDVTG